MDTPAEAVSGPTGGRGAVRGKSTERIAPWDEESGMTRRTWVYDPWADDDEAIVRMRDALALEPTPEPVEAEPKPAPIPEPVAPEETKRGRVAELVARVQAGDLSAVEMLRRLIDGR
jgi:hypothetical protein